MNWTKSNSFKLSMILVKVTFLLLIAMLFVIPPAVSWYDAVSGKAPIKLLFGAVLYFSDVTAFFVIGALYKLIKNIESHDIFIDKNVTYLRFISWGLMAVSLYFVVLTAARPVAIVVAFVMAFLGLIIRVLKNVFQEAVALQNEQDFTI